MDNFIKKILSINNSYKWLIYCLTLAILLLFYFPMFMNGFIYWKDIDLLYETSQKYNQTPHSLFFIDHGLEPMFSCEFFLFYLFNLSNPIPYHFINIGLHCLVAVVVYYFIKRFLSNYYEEKSIDSCSLIGALFFLFHPISSETIFWVYSFCIELMLLFFLISSLFYLKYLKNTSNKKFLFFSIFFFLFSCLSSRYAYPLSLIIIILDIYTDNKLTIKRVLARCTPFLIISATSFSVYYFKNFYHYSVFSSNSLDNILPFISSIFQGCRYLIFPFDIAFISPPIFEISYTNYSMLIIGSIFFILFVSILLFSFFGKHKILQFCTLLSLILLVFSRLFAEDIDILNTNGLNYVSVIGVSILLSLICIKLSQMQFWVFRWNINVLLIVVLIYASCSYKLMKVWKNEITLWESISSEYSGSRFAAEHKINSIDRHRAVILQSFGKSKPEVEFRNVIFDLGKIDNKNIQNIVFEFTNNDPNPVIINRVKSSCGCSTPTWSFEPILSKNKGFIHIKYDPSGMIGFFSKKIQVFFNNYDQPTELTLTGYIL